jgi:hypothetical protein
MDVLCRNSVDGQHVFGPADPKGRIYCRACGKPLMQIVERECHPPLILFGALIAAAAVAATALFCVWISYFD